MIIFEGPDGAGKTTLLQQLAADLNLPVAPRVVSKDAEAMVDLREWVDENLEQGFQRTIFDRHRMISEPIYGPILRDRMEPGFDSLSWFGPRLRRFYQVRPLIVYCLPPLAEVWSNVKDDPDNKAVNRLIPNIYSAYVARAAFDCELHRSTTFVWDYTTSPMIKDRPAFWGRLAQQLELQGAGA